MPENNILVELRFDRDARDAYDTSAKSLASLDVEKSEASRDPTLLAALTVAAAAISLTTELVKLAMELRSSGKKKGVLVVKLDRDNKEQTLSLLEASDSDIKVFITGN